MLKKLDRAVNQLTKNFELAGTDILLPGRKILINKNNFFEIKYSFDYKKKIGFIDGGNGVIISSVNFSVQLIKIYWTVYQNNKRIKNKSDEFLIVINFKPSESPFYEVSFFDKNEIFIFNAFEGGHLVNPEVIGEKIRKIFEIKECSELAEHCDIIIRDGDLEINDFDKTFYDTLFELCRKKNKAIAGLSKTTTILCNNGLSTASVLSRFSELKTWVYKADEKILFAKLHPRSRHVFRIDVMDSSDELISLLKFNSIDLTFPGYPYGLIEADKMARVTNNECRRMKLYLMAKYEKELDPHLSSIDAHDKL